MKIATWNVNSLKVRLPHLLDWLQIANIDVLALQEIKTIDDGFPRAELEAAGRSEEHTSELQSLMRISYAVFCLKKKQQENNQLFNSMIQTTQYDTFIIIKIR